MTEMDELLKPFEPQIANRDSRLLVNLHGDTAMLASIAISMKRIADALDHIVNYGVITGEE